jgi:hypothetical protein
LQYEAAASRALSSARFSECFLPLIQKNDSRLERGGSSDVDAVVLRLGEDRKKVRHL